MFRPFRILKNLRHTSEIIFNDKNRFRKLIEESGIKAAGVESLKVIAEDLKLIFCLCNDYLKGDYRGIKKSSIILIIGAMLYLLNPIDLVPDFLLGVGFLDDLSVFNYVLKKIKKELKKYEQWKND